MLTAKQIHDNFHNDLYEIRQHDPVNSVDDVNYLAVGSDEDGWIVDMLAPDLLDVSILECFGHEETDVYPTRQAAIEEIASRAVVNAAQ